MRVLLTDRTGTAGHDYTAQWVVTLMRDFSPWEHGRGIAEKRFEPRWPRRPRTPHHELEQEPRRGSIPEKWVH